VTGALADDRHADDHETLEQLATLAAEVRTAITRAMSPVILTHASADADAVASALGMAALCTEVGVPPVLVAAGDAALPANLEFLPDAGRLKQIDDAAVRDADLLIFVDCSDPSRLGPLYERLKAELDRERPSINIDHHVTNRRAGQLNVVIPEAGSTAEIITALFRELRFTIPPQTATELLAGIYGDTLGLRTPSTTPAALRSAASLLEDGADLDTIVDALFRLKPYSTVCLWGEALQRTEWRGGLIWTMIDEPMLQRAGADRSEAEGIVNFLAGTIGARAAAMLYAESWGWRVSMRTLANDVDVALLLKRFNGGGHTRAAGARLDPGLEARDRFLDEVAAFLGPRQAEGLAPGWGNEPD
jgi:phosphoesterase RecJ-like protein